MAHLTDEKIIQGRPVGAVPGRRPRRTAILTIISASYLMIVLDISIVIAALPKLSAGLGFSATGPSWVQSAYTLAFGARLRWASPFPAPERQPGPTGSPGGQRETHQADQPAWLRTRSVG